MAKNKTSTKKPARRTPRSEAKCLSGRAQKGKEFEPAHESVERLAATLVKLHEPRPYKNRYPVSEDEFQKLKDAARKAKLARIKATLAQDKGKKLELALAEAPAGPVGGGAPTPSTNFCGIDATPLVPPDCTIAVGPSHVVLSVNNVVSIYNKTGGKPLLTRTLSVWFNNVIQNATVFDPKLLYDQHTGRWVLLAAAFAQKPNRGAYLFSVSSTSDPMGQWRNYNLNAMVDGNHPTNNFADFPGLGVDSNNLYFTSNQFAFDGDFQYAKIRVVPKDGPYSGGAAPFHDFIGMTNPDGSPAFTIQPCHTFGAPQVEYLVNSVYPIKGRTPPNFLTVWVVTQTTTSPVLTRTAVQTSPYTLPPNAEQKGDNAPLNTGDARMLNAVFRGDSIWCALTTAHNWGGTSSQASVQWFQIRAAVPALVQEGIYGASNLDYFYPACCPDDNGNLILVFSRSGKNEFASIYYAGRKATDPLGSLQPSVLLKAGVANNVKKDKQSRNRWGDYNGICADPASPRGIWFYSEFVANVNEWGTWVGSAFF